MGTSLGSKGRAIRGWYLVHTGTCFLTPSMACLCQTVKGMGRGVSSLGSSGELLH